MPTPLIAVVVPARKLTYNVALIPAATAVSAQTHAIILTMAFAMMGENEQNIRTANGEPIVLIAMSVTEIPLHQALATTITKVAMAEAAHGLVVVGLPAEAGPPMGPPAEAGTTAIMYGSSQSARLQN